MESTEKIRISSEQSGAGLDRRISVAPMMDWNDEVRIRKDLNQLTHCQNFRPHFVPTE